MEFSGRISSSLVCCVSPFDSLVSVLRKKDSNWVVDFEGTSWRRNAPKLADPPLVDLRLFWRRYRTDKQTTVVQKNVRRSPKRNEYATVANSEFILDNRLTLAISTVLTNVGKSLWESLLDLRRDLIALHWRWKTYLLWNSHERGPRQTVLIGIHDVLIHPYCSSRDWLAISITLVIANAMIFLYLFYGYVVFTVMGSKCVFGYSKSKMLGGWSKSRGDCSKADKHRWCLDDR